MIEILFLSRQLTKWDLGRPKHW